MLRSGFPMAPTVLGLVLGPMLEGEMRRSLILSRGEWDIFFTRPICLTFILLSLFVCIATVVRANRTRKEDHIVSGI